MPPFMRQKGTRGHICGPPRLAELKASMSGEDLHVGSH